MKKKISVIMSVYNTEEYVEKAIMSILNQTYKDLELVLVDDCSKDNSRKILRRMAKTDKRIILIENETNKGLSYSRNIALEKSTGDYISYIDSDDYISLNYYEEIMKSLLKDKSDLAITDIKTIYENENNRELIHECSDEEATKLSIINKGLASSACNKVFKRELISVYKFSEGKVNEDIAVVIPSVINAKKISYVKNVYYYYVQRDNSIQNSSFSDKRFDIFYGVELTLERIRGAKQYNKIKDALVYNQLILLLIYVIPKEPKFSKRYKILKKFNKLIKPYNMRQNKDYWDFIDRQGKLHKLYYKTMIRLNNAGLSFLANLAIEFYKKYTKIFKKSVIKESITLDDLIDLAKKQEKMSEKIKLSVVLPSYNYGRFLYERLYSILYQNVKISELILLDDCSKDNTRELIDEIEEKISPYVNVIKEYNKNNSGSAFKQWEKGFNMATGDYVWIAEADDYCSPKLLNNLLKPIIKDNDIMLSYCDTAFVDTTGNVFMKSIKNEIDIRKTGHWDKSYVNDGIDEIENYMFLNCTVANVSSSLIKKGNYNKYFKMSKEYKQAGDWLLYVNVVSHGKIAYTDKALNYYRLHGNNVSSVTEKEAHMKEIKKIHQYYLKTFNLKTWQKKEIEKRYKFLKKVWNLK